MSEEFEGLEPSLRNVVEQKTLKWVFVGGEENLLKSSKVLSHQTRFRFKHSLTRSVAIKV